MLKELLQSRKPAFHRNYLAFIHLLCEAREAQRFVRHGSHGTETLLSIGGEHTAAMAVERICLDSSK